jgi:hypothetical protein
MTSHRAALVALLACVSLVGRCVVADSPTLSAGARHTCAIDGADRLHCWGDDSDGQSTVPADVPAWRAVAASKGGCHTCGIAMDGGVRCWGCDDNYESSGVPGGSRRQRVDLRGRRERPHVRGRISRPRGTMLGTVHAPGRRQPVVRPVASRHRRRGLGLRPVRHRRHGAVPRVERQRPDHRPAICAKRRVAGRLRRDFSTPAASPRTTAR